MAQTSRISTLRGVAPPTRTTARSWIARKQLDLHRRRHFADLVEEQGAAVGLFEHAAPFPVGAGEGALVVAEELRLDQVFRDGAAVHRDEGGLAIGIAGTMQRSRHLFLAGAGFARDQHRAAAGREARQQGFDLAHGGGNAQLRIAVRGRLLALAQAADLGDQFADIEGLGDVVVGAQLEQAHRLVDGAVAGNEDEWRQCSGYPRAGRRTVVRR